MLLLRKILFFRAILPVTLIVHCQRRVVIGMDGGGEKLSILRLQLSEHVSHTSNIERERDRLRKRRPGAGEDTRTSRFHYHNGILPLQIRVTVPMLGGD